MKTHALSAIITVIVIISSCATTKNMDGSKLFNTTWELEYISGTRIAFDGLFPDKKPRISFNKATSEVSGNNSCNGYSAKYTLDGTNLSFGEPGPTTMMYCGEGEKQFLNMIKKINKYNFDEEGKLNLMADNVSMMRFKKVAL